jgi:uncharacterized membrane protein YfcA
MAHLNLPELTPALLLVVAAFGLIGYIIFGATGFGSAIVSVPLLAHVLPLAACVPLITMLDTFAATSTSWRNRRIVAWPEFMRLAPAMFVGIALGGTLLVKLPATPALLALGVFVTVYGAYVLSGAPRPAHTPAWLVWPIGVVGGVFSALFGTGGPVYIVYLSARIHDKSALRATAASVVALSVWLRVVLFVVAGVLLERRLLLLIATLVPVMVIGVHVGHRLHARLSNDGVRRLIAALLVVNGLTLLARVVT